MENKNEKVSAREYYFKLDEKPSFTQLTKTGIYDNLHNVFRFADEYHRDQSKSQTTSQKETIERFLKWHKTEDEKPEEGKQYLVYDEINGICFDCWVKLYEEPVPGMGRICIGEGWEETEIEGSYWMEIPNYPEAEQLLKETEQ